MTQPRIKISVRLPAELVQRLADHAERRRASQTAVVEAALESLLSPDAAERLEAALARRLDRLGRQMDRLEGAGELSNETLALFIRTWFNNTPALPETAIRPAQVSGRARWEGFVAMLSRRMERGPRLSLEVAKDVNNE